MDSAALIGFPPPIFEGQVHILRQQARNYRQELLSLEYRAQFAEDFVFGAFAEGFEDWQRDERPRHSAALREGPASVQTLLLRCDEDLRRIWTLVALTQLALEAASILEAIGQVMQHHHSSPGLAGEVLRATDRAMMTRDTFWPLSALRFEVDEKEFREDDRE